MKKRLLSIFMAATMAIGLLPTAAYADDTHDHDHVHERAKILLGGTQMLGEQVDRLYFGNYMQSKASDGTFPEEPIKWRVLEDDGETLFMISDQNLDILQYHTNKEAVWWKNSTIRSWLNGYGADKNKAGTDYSSSNFYDTAFTSDEKKAIATSNLQNEAGEENTDDKIFLLSYAEAADRKYFHEDTLHGEYFDSVDNSRQATNTEYVANKGSSSGYGKPYSAGESNPWWLRTSGINTDYAAAVERSGHIWYSDELGLSSGVVNGWEYAIRPALRLNLSKVLFVSAADGAKSGASSLQAVEKTTEYDWKPTFLDSTRTFSANVVSDLTDQTKAVIQPGGTVKIKYDNAKKGVNEYISVIIADEHENTLYYGRVKNITDATDASATADAPLEIRIPAALPDGDYKLKIFNEQYNGGTNDTNKKPDYASKFTEIALTVDRTPPVLSITSTARYTQATGSVTFHCSEKGTFYYKVTTNMDEAAPEADDLIIGNGTKCLAGNCNILFNNFDTDAKRKVFIILVDEAGNKSNVLEQEIPVHDTSASDSVCKITTNAPAQIDFGKLEKEYVNQPHWPWTVTVMNAGTKEVKLEFVAPAADTQLNNFEIISTFDPASIAAGKTATFTVRPKEGLSVGKYEETIIIQGVATDDSGDTTDKIEIKLLFEVTKKPETYTYTIEVSAYPPEGGVAMGGKKYLEREKVLLSAQANRGYRFDGWTEDGIYLSETSNELSFDAVEDRTLVAQFKRIQSESSGGGGGSSEPAKKPDKEPDIKPEERPAEPDMNEREEEQPVLPINLPFEDVSEEDWFYDAVAEAYRNGRMTGTSATTFSPYDEITRAMTVNVFRRMAGQPDHGTESHYPDVASDQWYSRSLAWATMTDVAHGYENGHFGPHDPVTREQMAAFFHRWAAYNNHGLTARDDLSDFTDADRVSGWARESVEWAVGNGLLVGRDGKRLDPTTPVTRAEFAAMLQRYLVAVEGISAETVEAILNEEIL